VVSAYALESEIGTVASLIDERLERRDPFVPLLELTHKKSSKSLAEAAAVTAQEEPYRYRAEGRRDPFRSVLDVDSGPVLNAGPLTPLEQFEPTQLRLVGLMWNSKGYRALLETPDGMAYTAKLGTAIGMNGTISHVNEEHVIVRQSVRDVFGEEKKRDIELNLYPDDEALFQE